VRDEKVKMKAKIQSDIDLVQRKFKEEKMEKRQRTNADMARNRAVRNATASVHVIDHYTSLDLIYLNLVGCWPQEMKETHDAEIKRLKYMLNEATKESDLLQKKEAEESRIAFELEENRSRIEESFRETKTQVIAQEKRLNAVVRECEQKAASIRKDGELRLMQAGHEKDALEKKLVSLIEDHPKKRDEWEQLLESLKADNAREVSVAKTKVMAMIKNKQSSLEKEAAKLLHLRQETAHLKM
jgi:hypothetical protein